LKNKTIQGFKIFDLMPHETIYIKENLTDALRALV